MTSFINARSLTWPNHGSRAIPVSSERPTAAAPEGVVTCIPVFWFLGSFWRGRIPEMGQVFVGHLQKEPPPVTIFGVLPEILRLPLTEVDHEVVAVDQPLLFLPGRELRCFEKGGKSGSIEMLGNLLLVAVIRLQPL